jgi:uncharacterized protein (DUF779 family)
MVDRVIATPATLELIELLKQQYGPALMFHQSGGCCDNSAANCYLPTDLTIGPYDVHLGDIGGVPFYISASQYEYWKHTQLIIDVIDGQGGTFSLCYSSLHPEKVQNLVTMVTPGLWMPRVVMHWWAASITTATPLGCSTSLMVLAIWAVSFS